MKNESSAIEQYESQILTNEKLIMEKHKNEIKTIKNMFDIEYSLLLIHAQLFDDPYVEFDRHTNLIITAFGKNMFSIYSALDLTNKGLYGSARILLRYVFEFLIIGKYASLSKDSTFINKWENGKDISLRIDVFNKILSPNSDEIKRLWKLLCEYTHGTIYSQQASLNFEETSREISLNLLYLRMFLEMNYHLLNTHLLNKSIKYYTQQAEGYVLKENGGESEIKQLRNKIKDIFKVSKQVMEKEPRKVIYDYKLKWVFKN